MPTSILSAEKLVRPVFTTAVRYIKKMATGGSDSRLLECDRGRFVVKFRPNPQGSKVLANELISGLLALAITLPSPSPAIVTVSQEFMQANSAILARFEAGPQFGSFYLGQLDGGEPKALSETVVKEAMNAGDLAGIMALDLWVGNTDRKEEHVLLHGGCLYPIDHGHNFTGPGWTADSLGKAGEVVNDDWRLKRFATGLSVGPYIERILALDPATLGAVIAEVPPEWGLSAAEREVLLDFLVRRQPLIARVAG